MAFINSLKKYTKKHVIAPRINIEIIKIGQLITTKLFIFTPQIDFYNGNSMKS